MRHKRMFQRVVPHIGILNGLIGYVVQAAKSYSKPSAGMIANTNDLNEQHMQYEAEKFVLGLHPTALFIETWNCFWLHQ